MLHGATTSVFCHHLEAKYCFLSSQYIYQTIMEVILLIPYIKASHVDYFFNSNFECNINLHHFWKFWGTKMLLHTLWALSMSQNGSTIISQILWQKKTFIFLLVDSELFLVKILNNHNLKHILLIWHFLLPLFDISSNYEPFLRSIQYGDKAYLHFVYLAGHT